MLYIACAGVQYEGSGHIGIFTSLVEAMFFAAEDCDKHGYEQYVDNYWYVQIWDTEYQQCIKTFEYDKQARTWSYYDFEARVHVPFKP